MVNRENQKNELSQEFGWSSDSDREKFWELVVDGLEKRKVKARRQRQTLGQENLAGQLPGWSRQHLQQRIYGKNLRRPTEHEVEIIAEFLMPVESSNLAEK